MSEPGHATSQEVRHVSHMIDELVSYMDLIGKAKEGAAAGEAETAIMALRMAETACIKAATKE